MNPRFVIEIDWERLEDGRPEERATFGAIGFRAGDAWLTEANDRSVNRVRQKVHLSGYQLANWLAWNWWRLLWEPMRRSLAWKMAHRLPTIGGGYVWPNVDCVTDGERVLLHASPTRERASEPLRYVAEASVMLSTTEFQSGVDRFIEVILEQLRTEGVRETDLEQTWTDVVAERSEPESAWYRRLEAAMGYDPDEAADQVVSSLIAEAQALGKNGVAELAAGASPDVPAPGSSELRAIADSDGQDVDLDNIPRLPTADIEQQGAGKPAWAVGDASARALREISGLGGEPVSDQRLAELAGVLPSVLSAGGVATPFSFALSGDGEGTRVVLQSPIPSNRRFAIARLIGDRILAQVDEPLIPIMRTSSFRQKRQRAFAAELLCPFSHARQLLDEEISDESQERVAAEYKVSPMLVRTQLVNNGFLQRSALDDF